MPDSNTPYADVFAPPLPQVNQPQQWGKLYGSAGALALVAAANKAPGPLLLVVPGEQQAWWLEAELQFFGANQQLPIWHFRDWETLPYDVFSPQQEVVSSRLATLWNIRNIKRGFIITTAAGILQRLCPPSFLDSSAFMFSTGETLDINSTRERLQAAGYSAVEQVVEHGQYAVRGALFDVFPMGSSSPYRFDLFDDEIESIKTFDPETQRSENSVKRVQFLPGREIPTTPQAISEFRRRFREQFSEQVGNSMAYLESGKGELVGGIEYFLPLFFEETATLFDYLPANVTAVRYGQCEDAWAHEWQQISERYTQRCEEQEEVLPHPEQLWLPPLEIEQRFAAYPVADAQRFELMQTSAAAHNFFTVEPPSLQMDARAEEPAEALINFLKSFDGRVLLVAESEGRRETLQGILRGHHIPVTAFEHWHSFVKSEDNGPIVGITLGQLQHGLLLNSPKVAIIAESQLFGGRAQQMRRRKRRGRDPQSVVKELTDLTIGAPVVHEDHGIGRYLGLETLEVGGVSGEFLTLEYAEDNKLYVPVHALHLISRYTGTDPEAAPLHRLGSGQWDKARKKAAQKARDVAAELLDIHAKRAARSGHAHQIDDAEYAAFAASFPFDETEDQSDTINAIIADLRSDKPMDRVVCGDVGFGKTEVAMRAAFVAAQSGQQVAVLVPTTLLAQQHYQNFLDRFAQWPVKIEQLSRFRTAAQKTKIMGQLKSGAIDIVIGTHALLSARTDFKRLGLVIIDEEHRFGVRHKEQMKKLRAEVDILTMTATPIPRTLNMGLAGMRDLSIIATPPANRQAVKTFVSQWDSAVVSEACMRELRRGGQVYFLHNNVETIEKTEKDLQELLPDARIRHAHGQMREQELEQTMLDFSHRRFDVLVATTIIESGIDVPNANTIIINRADKLGLAQLHQIRGRVGRSHLRGYCYLITPPPKLLTANAEKRLQAIESLEDLGAGFSLATHDMEIRGAGELLGDEQSGQIQEIGFSMYMELLERAVKALKSGNNPELAMDLDRGPEVDLKIPAVLPDDYIHDVHQRLVLYKRIASASDANGLKELQVELIDRFGLLPDAAKMLFEINALKQQAAEIGIRKLDGHAGGLRVVFTERPNVDPMRLIQMIQKQPNLYRFNGTDTLHCSKDMPEPEQRLDSAQKLLNVLAGPEK
jgi:transcription-repair coupling factor (superfamily II helicase)